MGEGTGLAGLGGVGLKLGGGGDRQKVTSRDKLITEGLIVPPRCEVGIPQQNPLIF